MEFTTKIEDLGPQLGNLRELRRLKTFAVHPNGHFYGGFSTGIGRLTPGSTKWEDQGIRLARPDLDPPPENTWITSLIINRQGDVFASNANNELYVKRNDSSAWTKLDKFSGFDNGVVTFDNQFFWSSGNNIRRWDDQKNKPFPDIENTNDPDLVDTPPDKSKNFNFNDIVVDSSLFAGTNRGVIVRTRIGRWEKTGFFFTNPNSSNKFRSDGIHNITALTQTHFGVIAATKAGKIMASKDGGKSWIEMANFGSQANIKQIIGLFFGQLVAIINDDVFISLDSGASWSKVAIPLRDATVAPNNKFTPVRLAPDDKDINSFYVAGNTLTRCPIFKISIVDQRVTYGSTYRVRNHFKDETTFLEVAGVSNCSSRTVFDVGSTKANSNKTSWEVISAGNKTDNLPVLYGDLIHLRNTSRPMNDNGQGLFLDTCGTASCTTGTFRDVSVSIFRRGDSGSGIWKVVSATGKNEGSAVLLGDTVHLENQWSGGKSFLDTCGRLVPGVSLQVSTNVNPKRSNNAGTGTWSFLEG